MSPPTNRILMEKQLGGADPVTLVLTMTEHVHVISAYEQVRPGSC